MSQKVRRAARARVVENQVTTEIPVAGLRPAREGVQPVQDLATLLQALPDFGEDAERLRQVIAEDRAFRRAAVDDPCS